MEQGRVLGHEKYLLDKNNKFSCHNHNSNQICLSCRIFSIWMTLSVKETLPINFDSPTLLWTFELLKSTCEPEWTF